MNLYTTTFSTEFGLFSAAVDEHGAVVATAFGGLDALSPRVPRDFDHVFRDDFNRTRPVREQVLAYARGERHDFEVPLRAHGTPFQRRVWGALVEIPLGETRSYGDLALILGSGPRAVGAANGANPICLLIPCHRVVGKHGDLTGFAFGNTIKAALLGHERRMIAVAA